MLPSQEETLVRRNLMEKENYTPYCGSFRCNLKNPRVKWTPNMQQFSCKCGWVSQFPADFIKRYKQKWNK